MEEILAVQERRDGDTSVVHPIGEVDMQTMRPLRELVRRLPEEGVRFLVFDLRDVNFIDSAGMSVLFAAKKRLIEDRGECYLVTNGDSFVARTLQTIAIDKVMPHLHDPQEAMEDIEARRQGRAPEAAHPCLEDFSEPAGTSEMTEPDGAVEVDQDELKEDEADSQVGAGAPTIWA